MRRSAELLVLLLAACAPSPVTDEEFADTAVPTTEPAFRYAWAKRINGPGLEFPHGAFAGPTRSFIAGAWCANSVGPNCATVLSPFLDAIDAAGERLWLRSFSTPGQFFRVVGTADEDVVVAGAGPLATDVGCGTIPHTGDPQASQGILAKYDGATGMCLWHRVWPGSKAYSVEALAAEPDGGFVVAGRFSGTVDLGRGVVLESQAVEDQLFVARVDERGHGRWARIIGDPSESSTADFSQLMALTTDGAGNSYLASSFMGGVDLLGQFIDRGNGARPVGFVLAIDGAGAARWRFFNTSANLAPIAIHTQAGRLAVVGAFSFPFAFAGHVYPGGLHGADLFVLDFGLDGRQRWAQTFQNGPGANINAGDVFVDDADRVNVVGTFIGGKIQVGSVVFPPPREQPGYLAVLDANDGSVRRVNMIGGDKAVINFPRLSFAPTGFRLLSISLEGQGDFGDAVFGRPLLPPFIDVDVTAVYASLIR